MIYGFQIRLTKEKQSLIHSIKAINRNSRQPTSGMTLNGGPLQLSCDLCQDPSTLFGSPSVARTHIEQGANLRGAHWHLPGYKIATVTEPSGKQVYLPKDTQAQYAKFISMTSGSHIWIQVTKQEGYWRISAAISLFHTILWNIADASSSNILALA